MTASRDQIGDAAAYGRSNSGLDDAKASTEAEESPGLSVNLWNEMRSITESRAGKNTVSPSDDSTVTLSNDVRAQGPEYPTPAPLPPGLGLGGDVYKVAPSIYIVKHGDRLERIAKTHLGGKVETTDLNSHIANIVRINGLKSKDIIKEKQVLELPGETKDGGFAVKDPVGNVKVQWKNGSVRETNNNGTGFTKNVGVDGSMLELHWGPRPADNYRIEKAKTGIQVLTDIAEQHVVQPTQDKAVQAQRAKLLEHASMRLSDAHQRSKFEFDMSRFEQRAGDMGMPMEEVKKTYEQVDRLLVDGKNDLVSGKLRTRLAQQIIGQAALPTTTDQGIYKTCSVSSLEVRTYSLYPSSAAQVVADAAIKGSFTSKDGTTVKIDPTPYGESLQELPKDGSRSHASQLFQVAAVNLHYEKVNQSKKPPGQLRYEQHPANTFGSENGEGVFDYANVSKRSPFPTLVYSQPELWDDDLVEVGNAISGRNETGFVLVHEGEGKDSKNVVGKFASIPDLQTRLVELSSKKMLPASFRVHSANEPIYSDSGDGKAGGSGGWHELTVLTYDPATQSVEVDNTWGSPSDHRSSRRLSVDELYATTRSAGSDVTIAVLEQAAGKRQLENKYDLIADLDLARQKRLGTKTTPEQYVDELWNVMRDSKCHDAATLPDSTKLKAKVNQVTQTTFTQKQEGEVRIKVLQMREQVGLETKEHYEDELYNVAMEISNLKAAAIKKGEPLSGAPQADFDSTLAALNVALGDFETERRDKFIKRVKKDAPAEIFDQATK